MPELIPPRPPLTPATVMLLAQRAGLHLNSQQHEELALAALHIEPMLQRLRQDLLYKDEPAHTFVPERYDNLPADF